MRERGREGGRESERERERGGGGGEREGEGGREKERREGDKRTLVYVLSGGLGDTNPCTCT